MVKLIDQLDEITNELIEARQRLDSVERDYFKKKAELLMFVFKDFGNQEVREAQVSLAMENDNTLLLDAYYEAKDEVRKLTLKRECLMERIKQSRADSMV